MKVHPMALQLIVLLSRVRASQLPPTVAALIVLRRKPMCEASCCPVGGGWLDPLAWVTWLWRRHVSGVDMRPLRQAEGVGASLSASDGEGHFSN